MGQGSERCASQRPVPCYVNLRSPRGVHEINKTQTNEANHGQTQITITQALHDWIEDHFAQALARRWQHERLERPPL